VLKNSKHGMSDNGLLKQGERLDDLHRNGYKIIQNPAYFAFGMDAVLLSAFTHISKGEVHLDLCCGNGIVPILLAARYPHGNFSGIEIQQPLADMAIRSVAYNGLTDRIRIVHSDIKQARGIFGHAAFDVVTANPPYIAHGDGLENESQEMAIARHEILCTLEDVCNCAADMLRFGGRFYMVHRPDRTADIICTLRKAGLEPKTLRFVQPKEGSNPNTLLIMATKGGRPQLNVGTPLVVYDEKGNYTREVYDIYYG